MRLAITIRATDATHALTPEKEAGRWRAGEPVDVFDADSRGGFVGPHPHPAFYRIFVDDWAGTLAEARTYFLAEHRDVGGALLARRRRVFDLEPALDDELKRERHLALRAADLTTTLATRPAGTR